MSFEQWKARVTQNATRENERRKLEANFNAAILQRHRAGDTKEEIVADMGITRELFNRVIRAANRVADAGADVG